MLKFDLKNLKMGRERWAVLLVCGILLLLISFPMGGGGKKTEALSSAAAVVNGTEEGISREERGGEEDTEAGAPIPGQASPQLSYEREMEERVREILKHTDGVGEVDVMIVLKSTEEKVIHEDETRNRTSTEETDSSGGARKVMSEELSRTAVYGENGGEKTPVVEKELRPEIEGIVISAQGGGSATVKAEISEAMEALFNIPPHKIKVLKRVEQKE